MSRWPRLVAGLALAASVGVRPAHPTARASADLPDRIADQDFWNLTETLSEPNGTFHWDSLVSNESQLQSIIPDLLTRTAPGGVYLGVGPEQNFTYIAALKPKLAFIIDVRRGNLQLQLMYKALFELSADRADFVSRLFTKKRPEGLGAQSTAADLMGAYWDIPTSAEAVYRRNLQAIIGQLTGKHQLPLSAGDLAGIEYVYHAFYWFGPAITYSSSSTGQNGGRTTYADLMMLTDRTGESRSYLATEASFALIRDLESRNLVVPVVGNFAGPKAIRAIGGYLRDRGATVTAFYLSNVEQYLNMDGLWPSFCANVAALPLDENSTFIRSARWQLLGSMLTETRGCGGAARAASARGAFR
jgi:hypothetical protein